MGKNMRGLVAITIGLAFLALTAYGCSNRDRETSRPQAEKEQAANPGTAGGEQDISTTGRSNWGDKCHAHFYYIAPGQSASLTFEAVIDARLAKTAREEEPTLRKEELEAVGYSVSYSNRSVDTFSASLPVWVLSEPDFAAKENERILYAPLNGWKVDWNRNGEGTITKVPGADGKFAVGRLPLEKLLGNRSAIDIKGPNGSVYSLTPSQKTLAEEFHILSVTFDVTAPRETVLRQNTRRAGVSWRDGGIGFDRIYDRDNERYVISGPAHSRDCFE
ncbi:MAG: hypothetical protein GXX82_06510 [Syntrophorhabdus sp.]|nr:hypothetical protein [Syntrophorhabdus sp.]